MSSPKSLVVALTRFFGILMVFYGLIAGTYAVPYYHRYITVFARTEAHQDAAILFGLAVLWAVLHIAAGMAVFSRAEPIIDALRDPEAEPGFRSLIVAVVKLNGFLLFFYAIASALTPDAFVLNLLHNGWSALPSGGPKLLRICLNLIGGFLVVTSADKIIERVERLGTAKGAP